MFSITEIWFFQMRNFVSPGCSYPCNCLILSRQADFCTRANLVNKVKSPSRLTLKKAFCMKKLGVCQIACPNCLRAWRSPYITCSRALRALLSHVSYALLYLRVLCLHFLMLIVLRAVRALLLLVPHLLQVL